MKCLNEDQEPPVRGTSINLIPDMRKLALQCVTKVTLWQSNFSEVTKVTKVWLLNCRQDDKWTQKAKIN